MGCPPGSLLGILSDPCGRCLRPPPAGLYPQDKTATGLIECEDMPSRELATCSVYTFARIYVGKGVEHLGLQALQLYGVGGAGVVFAAKGNNVAGVVGGAQQLVGQPDGF